MRMILSVKLKMTDNVTMRIFKTSIFDKFARKHQIDDGMLIEAVFRADQGLIDAELGSNIIKQRIARKGQGRSGGFRSFIFYRINENSYFVAGISKNEQENITPKQLTLLKRLAKEYEEKTEQQIEQEVTLGLLIEIYKEE